MPRPLRRLLVANRGEIAIRVIRACREMEITSIAVYSEADAGALHVRMADEAVYIGGAPASESYLSIARILDAAAASKAEAVHPGYGFLSENPDFAEACAQADLVFIGPSARAMRELGQKTRARALMREAGVPIVPGIVEPLMDAQEAITAAETLGYPIALKAVAGGGGKGLRIVERGEEMESAFRQASREAAAAFGDPSMYLEKALLNPRHVELQILADNFGSCVSLGERDCSLQRRHQKVLEESPSPVVSAELRTRMGEAAVQAAKAADYTGAGTVEFLLAETGEFYFLEVNARLQVEHPVTELVTGRNLVREQIRIASGEPLGYAQSDVESSGYALECRIYAEDPFNSFFPSTGTLTAYQPPSGPGVRVDGGVEEGSTVGVHYDPILAKLIVWAEDRPRGIARMRRALDEFVLSGVQSNIPLHRWLVRQQPFLEGAVHTSWLEPAWAQALAVEGELDPDEVHRVAIAAALRAERRSRLASGNLMSPPPASPAWRQAVRPLSAG